MRLSILLVRALVEELENSGVTRERFFSAAGLEAEELQMIDRWIALEEYDRLVELALSLTGNDGFGLRLGRRTSPTAHSLTGELVAHATTLRQGLDALVRYNGLVVDRPVIELTEQQSEATLAYRVTPGPLACRRFRAELALAGYCRMVRYFARGAWPTIVAFEHDAPPYREKYAHTFGGRERFSAGFTGIVFERTYLDVAQIHADADFYVGLEQQAARRLARMEASSTYADRVRAHLLDPATGDRRTMTHTAKALGVSVRSLRRKLQAEGLRYTEIVEDALPAVAKRLIAEEGLSIERAAYELGFSSPSAFHKAFKRWTGMTPGDYRNRAIASETRG